MEHVQLLIDGQRRDSSDGARLDTTNPATGEVIGTLAEATPGDVDEAVAGARKALESDDWARLSPDDRGRVLWRIADLIEEHGPELAALETMDQGQPTAVSQGISVPLAAQVFRYYAGYCTKIEGRQSPVSIPDQLTYQRRVPLGVCGLIIPWNFPLDISSWKLAPALATGNVAILKPAEQTPMTTSRLVGLCHEAGVPDGVVNLLTGGPTVGQALTTHSGVDMISFTGSTEVGQEIVRNASKDLKRVSLELGGKAPSIVCEDADIDAAVEGNLAGGMFNTGQACGAYTRFFVHRSRVDEFTTKLAAAAAALKVGRGLDPETVIGPMITEEHLNRVHGFVQRSQAAGADVVTGGERVGGELANGYFYRPTVITGVTDDMEIMRKEVFGPVMCITPYDDIDEAVQRANASDYGLVAVLWTQDLKTAHTIPPRLRAGTVFVNQLPLIDPNAPWGGFGLSGWGREMGSYSIEEFTEPQSVFINLA